MTDENSTTLTSHWNTLKTTLRLWSHPSMYILTAVLLLMCTALTMAYVASSISYPFSSAEQREGFGDGFLSAEDLQGRLKEAICYLILLGLLCRIFRNGVRAGYRDTVRRSGLALLPPWRRWAGIPAIIGVYAFLQWVSIAIPWAKGSAEFDSANTHTLSVSESLTFSLHAGINEEVFDLVILIGIPAVLLTAAGVPSSSWWYRGVIAGLVALSTLVRGGLHVYQDWNRGIVMGAIGLVLAITFIFLRCVWPFIAVHTFYDLMVSLAPEALYETLLSISIITGVATVVMFALPHHRETRRGQKGAGHPGSDGIFAEVTPEGVQ